MFRPINSGVHTRNARFKRPDSQEILKEIDIPFCSSELELGTAESHDTNSTKYSLCDRRIIEVSMCLADYISSQQVCNASLTW